MHANNRLRHGTVRKARIQAFPLHHAKDLLGDTTSTWHQQSLGPCRRQGRPSAIEATKNRGVVVTTSHSVRPPEL